MVLKSLFIFIIATILCSCVSIRKYNAQTEVFRSQINLIWAYDYTRDLYNQGQINKEEFHFLINGYKDLFFLDSLSNLKTKSLKTVKKLTTSVPVKATTSLQIGLVTPQLNHVQQMNILVMDPVMTNRTYFVVDSILKIEGFQIINTGALTVTGTTRILNIARLPHVTCNDFQLWGNNSNYQP